MKKVHLGVLGYGTVGQGVAKIIQERYEQFKEMIDVDIEIKKVLVRDLSKEREIKLDEKVFTLDYKEITENDEIDIVIELTGEIDKAYDMIVSALNNGKDVVTANKAVVSKYFEEFTCIAKEKDLNFLYEASVGGGIPIIKPLYDIVKLNRVKRVRGIMNGTCNYILSKMTEEGSGYLDVLKEAQELGYAEADPSSDVNGDDTLRKLRILSTIAFKQPIIEDEILMDGISKIKASDIKLLEKNGRVIKLIGDTWNEDGTIKSIVQPVAVFKGSYFSSVNGAFNSITVEGDMVGELKFYGSGAGMLPTANAVLTDCLDIILENQKTETHGVGCDLEVKSDTISGKFYIRYEGDNKELASYADEVLSESPYVIITKEVEFKKIKQIVSDDENTAIIRIEDGDY
ncbi:MAG: homoserine dehydrogenase [Tissierellia bacterium]|nr:homoserine dehydrogenase [Tissierellia bacterium]